MRATDNNGCEYFTESANCALGWILARNELSCFLPTCNIAVNSTAPDGTEQIEVWVYASRDDALNDWHGNLALGVIHGYDGRGLDIHYGLGADWAACDGLQR